MQRVCIELGPFTRTPNPQTLGRRKGVKGLAETIQSSRHEPLMKTQAKATHNAPARILSHAVIEFRTIVWRTYALYFLLQFNANYAERTRPAFPCSHISTFHLGNIVALQWALGINLATLDAGKLLPGMAKTDFSATAVLLHG